jgi:hypothetical protein
MIVRIIRYCVHCNVSESDINSQNEPFFHMKETNQTTRDTVIQQPKTLPPQDTKQRLEIRKIIVIANKTNNNQPKLCISLTFQVRLSY